MEGHHGYVPNDFKYVSDQPYVKGSVVIAPPAFAGSEFVHSALKEYLDKRTAQKKRLSQLAGNAVIAAKSINCKVK